MSIIKSASASGLGEAQLKPSFKEAEERSCDETEGVLPSENYPPSPSKLTPAVK